jgi:hypothetical protein
MHVRRGLCLLALRGDSTSLVSLARPPRRYVAISVVFSGSLNFKPSRIRRFLCTEKRAKMQRVRAMRLALGSQVRLPSAFQ